MTNVRNLRPITKRPYDWACDDDTRIAFGVTTTPWRLNMIIAYCCRPAAPAAVRDEADRWRTQIGEGL